MIKKLLIAMLIPVSLMIFSSLSYGSTTKGALLFLRMPDNARSSGLGEAYTAVATGVDALHWNPASLGTTDKTEVSFMNDNYIADLNFYYFGVKKYIEQFNCNIGFSFRNLNHGSFDGTLITSSTSYTSIGIFKSSDVAYALTISTAKENKVNFGGTVKYIESKIASSKASTFAFDLGWYNKWTEFEIPISAGFTIQNIGKYISHDLHLEELPLTLKFGGATDFIISDNITMLLAIDVIRLINSNSSDIDSALGIELNITDMFAFRTGYNSINDAGTGLSFGLGVNWNNLRVDYGFTDYGKLSSSNKISVNYNF
jgi:hypothetical protein